MEQFTMFFTGSNIVVFLLVLLGWKALNFLYLKPKRMEKFLRAQGFQGNSFKPFLGDLNESEILLRKAHSKTISLSDDFLPRVIPLFVKTFEKYGKNSFMWIGPKPSVLIWETQLIKEIMNNYRIFQKPEFNALTKLLSQGLVFYEGDKWLKHRKIVNPTFHIEKLKRISSTFILSTNDMLTQWEEITTTDEEIDVWPYIQSLSSDAISRAAFGSSYEEGKRIFELQREQADHFQTVDRTIFYFPGYCFFPTKLNKRMQYIRKEVEDSIQGIIEKRLIAMKNGESSNDDHDLLGLLLVSNFNEIKEKGDVKYGITMNDIIQECKLFYFAGSETTSGLLNWTLVLLSQHQEWQTRAREEVLRVFGTNTPHFDGLSHLKVVTMILNETLRLYPPVPAITRRVHKDTKLGKYHLVAGTMLTLPIIMLHHSKEIWGDDANEFNPERFSDGISNASNGEVAFLPFGWGPRFCIGQNFALVESKLALARILQHFSFELSKSYTHAPHRIVTLQPQYGSHLLFHKL